MLAMQYSLFNSRIVDNFLTELNWEKREGQGAKGRIKGKGTRKWKKKRGREKREEEERKKDVLNRPFFEKL